MQVNIYNKQSNPRLDSYVRDRLELVVGRYAERIAHVDVHLIDENGSKGGEDKVCTIDVKLIPRGQLHVRAKQESIYSAVVKAVHRAETVVSKVVDRGHRAHAVRRQNGGIRNIPHEEAGVDQSEDEPAEESRSNIF